jgi:hypothetical protein
MTVTMTSLSQGSDPAYLPASHTVALKYSPRAVATAYEPLGVGVRTVDPAGQNAVATLQPLTMNDNAPVPAGHAKPANSASRKLDTMSQWHRH